MVFLGIIARLIVRLGTYSFARFPNLHVYGWVFVCFGGGIPACPISVSMRATLFTLGFMGQFYVITFRKVRKYDMRNRSCMICYFPACI